MELTARNSDLQTLANLLKDQEAHKTDAIVKAANIRMTTSGRVEIFGTEPLVSEDGVTDMIGVCDLSPVALGHLAERFGIDTRYARKLAERRPDILASNVNGWIQGFEAGPDDDEDNSADPDGRAFTARTFQFEGQDRGLFRGLLSDRFSII